MSLRIQNNIEAFNAHRNLGVSTAKASKAMEKLSSGFRINRAADDAAGLAISEKLRGQIGGLAQSQRNAQDAISLVQTAEGSLSEVHSMLQRVRELAVQHKNGTLATADRTAIESEVAQLTAEIDRIGSDAQFNGISLFANSTISFQVGANDGQQITVSMKAMASLVGTISLTASNALASIDQFVGDVSAQRSTLGAVQNRLEHTLGDLATYQENLTASESRIRDVDMAQEMVNFSKLQILQQAGTSMLAQANQSSQGVLSLLK